MSVLLGLVLIVGGTGDDVDDDGIAGDDGDDCDDDGQFLTFLMAGTSQLDHWRRNVCFMYLVLLWLLLVLLVVLVMVVLIMVMVVMVVLVMMVSV